MARAVFGGLALGVVVVVILSLLLLPGLRHYLVSRSYALMEEAAWGFFQLFKVVVVVLAVVVLVCLLFVGFLGFVIYSIVVGLSGGFGTIGLCNAVNRDGTRCRNPVSHHGYCHIHRYVYQGWQW